MSTTVNAGVVPCIRGYSVPAELLGGACGHEWADMYSLPSVAVGLSVGLLSELVTCDHGLVEEHLPARHVWV